MMYYCTICAWLRVQRPCSWHGKAPSGQWHHLCYDCMILHGDKYRDVHKTGQNIIGTDIVIFK